MLVNRQTRKIKCPRCGEGSIAISVHLPERELVFALKSAPADPSWVAVPCEHCSFGVYAVTPKSRKPLGSPRRQNGR